MSLPKGFGKNYFTLSAITATVSQITINAKVSRVHDFHSVKYISDEVEDEVEDELDFIDILEENQHACHCNCYFLRYTKKTLKLCHSQNKFFRYFKTLNNAISPPYFI